MASIVLAGSIGTIIEWYDFLIYGTAAALVFNGLFFPRLDPTTGTIASLGTFAVGFLARPLGGALFGRFGDRIGRKTMLLVTMLVMALGTFGIGLLPTYGQVGIWAPVLLVMLRLVQGLGLGGEWGGASLMVLEHAPAGRRGFYGSLVQVGFPLGLVAASGAFALAGHLPDAAFRSWGWRVPFLASIVLLVVGAFVRARIPETPHFERLRESGGIARRPFLDVILKDTRSFLVSVGLKLSEVSWVYILTVFVVIYATTKLGVPKGLLLNAILIAAAVEVLTIPAFGWLSDQVGRRVFFLLGAVFTAGFAYPLFWMLDTGSPALITLAIVVALNLGHGAMFGLEFRLPSGAVRDARALHRRLVRLPGGCRAWRRPVTDPRGLPRRRHGRHGRGVPAAGRPRRRHLRCRALRPRDPARAAPGVSASALFPPPEERERWDDLLTRDLARADARVAAGPVMPTLDLAALRADLAGFDFEAPRPLDDLLAWTIAQMEHGVVHVTHPRYLGLFNPAPAFPAQCADRIAAAFNPQLATATTSPAAVEIEAHVVRAVARRAGFPAEAAGHFTSGGSEANLTALLCALTRAHPGFAAEGARAFPGPPVFYASRESHLAWLKIAHQLGIGRAAARLVATDGAGRMDPDALADAVEADRARGCVPVMVAATAGTTCAGMIDPLEACGAVARRAGLWYHVDAAWGGALVASERLRGLLAGLELAELGHDRRP